MMRIGQGFDAHRFTAGKPLVLGGVLIPHPFGLEAHSDGDVIIHALCDALLGAAGLGDIGLHFPDSDKRFLGIDSRLLLQKVHTLISSRYAIVNIDITLLAQVPKIAPFVEAMRRTLADDLMIEPSDISVKATTTEHMGFIGREEGLAAMAIVLLESKI